MVNVSLEVDTDQLIDFLIIQIGNLQQFVLSVQRNKVLRIFNFNDNKSNGKFINKIKPE